MKQLFMIILLLISAQTFAQINTAQNQINSVDTLSVVDTAATPFYKNLWTHDPHSVGQAALFSAIIPGLGQAYNGKYWKIPIVYGAIGTAGYFIYYWYSFYDELRTAYIYRTDDDPLTVDLQYAYLTSDDYLLQKVSQAKQYTDLMVVLTAAAYILNIVDAVVDAHLYDFNVNDDLSMRLQPFLTTPQINYNSIQPLTYGVSLKFSLK